MPEKINILKNIITTRLLITTIANIYIVLCARHHSKYFIHTYSLILINNCVIKILLLSPIKEMRELRYRETK